MEECLSRSVAHITHFQGGHNIDRRLDADHVITPWRHAWSDLPPAAVSSVVFDINLPINNKNRSSLGWMSSPHVDRTATYGVDEMTDLRLPILLLRQSKMRSKVAVRFDLAYNEYNLGDGQLLKHGELAAVNDYYLNCLSPF